MHTGVGLASWSRRGYTAVRHVTPPDSSSINPQVWKLDLASLKSVREFGAKWEQSGRELHILINNAGVLNMGGVKAGKCGV